MKKLFCIILVLILVLGICACNQKKTNNTDTTVNNPTNTTIPTTTTSPTTANTQPINPKALSDFTFTVYGKEFHLGMKMSDLLAAGVFTDCEYFGVLTNLEYHTHSLEPIANGSAVVNLSTEKKCQLHIHLWNLSRNTIDVKDATVVGISYNSEDWDASAKSIIGDVCFRGVKLNSSIEAVTDIFGKPNVHERTFDGEEYRGGGWRGFDIGEEFRMYLSVIHLKSLPNAQSMTEFELEFKPFTDNIQ